MATLSRQHYGHQTVMDLKKTAEKSIGLPLGEPDYIAERLTMNLWLQHILILKIQMNLVLEEMVRLAKQTPWFEILTSICSEDHKAFRIFPNRNGFRMTVRSCRWEVPFCLERFV
jgi:hypothetical protein